MTGNRAPKSRPKRQHTRPNGVEGRNRITISRVALLLTIVIIGYFAVTDSFANVYVKVDPARAHAMAPGNAVILAELAENSFSIEPAIDPNAPPLLKARRALLSDPLRVEALNVLGFHAQLAGDSAKADRIFSYSDFLSRRELSPRLWAIEKAIERGDIESALNNYDIALRTSSAAQGILFPVLNRALSEARIRAELLPILASSPAWKDAFLDYAAQSGLNPQGVADLLREGKTVGLVPKDDWQVHVVNAFFYRGQISEAWDLYASLRAGARKDRSRDANFALNADVRAPFDWQLAANTGASVGFRRLREETLFDFSAPPTTGGALVSQSQVLPPGTYRLEGRSQGLEQTESSRPFWALVCSSGRQLGRVPVKNSDVNDGRFGGTFTVPADCEAQTLSLVVRATDGFENISGQILWVQLMPIKNQD